MEKFTDNESRQFGNVVRRIAVGEECDSSDFLAFIRFCAERLNKGDSVQAIWTDYQNLVDGK